MATAGEAARRADAQAKTEALVFMIAMKRDGRWDVTLRGGREDLRGQVCAGTWVLFVDGQDRLVQKRLRNWRVRGPLFLGVKSRRWSGMLGGWGCDWFVRWAGVRDSWHYWIMHVG
jgi:hypothetical protein